jgi:hypothetical protein
LKHQNRLPDSAEIAAVWSNLSEHIKAAIKAPVKVVADV